VSRARRSRSGVAASAADTAEARAADTREVGPKLVARRPPANCRRQLALAMRTWGGKRPGSGRKPNGAAAGVPHLRRPVLRGDAPVHVTLRVRPGLPSLRRRGLFLNVHAALIEGRERFGLRLCQYSVQSNHIHLIVEATETRALVRGMQGLAIRIARTINRKLGVRGAVFADRYHARALKTPLEVRHALRYVLQNAAHHGWGRLRLRPALDPCSSAAVLCQDIVDTFMPGHR
jgi:putative transposase